jgi:transcriptional regulator with XRE-family HTH domain
VYIFFVPQPLKNKLKPLDLGGEPISHRLKQFRRQRGFSQAEIAEKIGVTRGAVSAYESGRVGISNAILVRFAIALGVSSDELLGISGQHLEKPAALRIMRRLKKIETLPPSKQKAILQTLDMALHNVEPQKSR